MQLRIAKQSDIQSEKFDTVITLYNTITIIRRIDDNKNLQENRIWSKKIGNQVGGRSTRQNNYW